MAPPQNAPCSPELQSAGALPRTPGYFKQDEFALEVKAASGSVGSGGGGDLASAHGGGYARGARARGGQAAGDANGKMREGLRLEHVAIKANGLDRIDRAGEPCGKAGHHGGVVTPAPGDKYPFWR